ncbi:hypothetical protein Pmani_029464 [Petrolisthes manimaculis]|uniref:Uncharacterized protein n=1 Tax=Petrolisthes manimaculis TaxID=1843537 RepID=A0AAE1NXZ4_9EUCA|nr:hypothetical protein Pmani_029464 [Petrolisthes manimaculis]
MCVRVCVGVEYRIDGWKCGGKKDGRGREVAEEWRKEGDMVEEEGRRYGGEVEGVMVMEEGGSYGDGRRRKLWWRRKEGGMMMEEGGSYGGEGVVARWWRRNGGSYGGGGVEGGTHKVADRWSGERNRWRRKHCLYMV